MGSPDRLPELGTLVSEIAQRSLYLDAGAGKVVRDRAAVRADQGRQRTGLEPDRQRDGVLVVLLVADERGRIGLHRRRPAHEPQQQVEKVDGLGAENATRRPS